MDNTVDIFVGILEVEFESGLTLKIISNTHGTKGEGEGDEKKDKKDFNEKLVIFQAEKESYKIAKITEDNKTNKIEIKPANDGDSIELPLEKYDIFKDKIKDYSGKEDELRQLWEHLNSLFNVKSLKGVDLPLEWNKKQNKYDLAEDEGIRIRLTDLKGEKDKQGLKIYDRCAIGLSETATYDVEIKSNDKKEGNSNNEKKQYKLRLSYEVLSSRYITPFGSGGSNAFRINFHGQTFFGELNVYEKENEKEIAHISVLVFPTKLSTEEAEKIVDELIKNNEKIEEISPTALHLKPGDTIAQNPLRTLLIIRQMFRERFNRPSLGKTLRSISSNPDKIIRSIKIERQPHEVESPDIEDILEGVISAKIKRVNEGEYHFKYLNNKFAFTSLIDEEFRISYDTYPNRFVKYFLEFLKNTASLAIGNLKKELQKYEGNFVQNIIADVERSIRKHVNTFLSQEWLAEVEHLAHLSQPPQKLLKDLNYSSAFFDYLDLVRKLKILDKELEEYLRNPITYMPELYELWCGLKLKEITQKKVESQMIYKHKENDWFSYSVPLKPDFTIKKDKDLFLFDAKYRVDFVKELIEESEEESEKIDKIRQEEKRGEFKRADLYKMHTYREAIIKKEGNERPIWVFALYPGDTLALFSTSDKKLIINLKLENKKLKFEIVRDKRKYSVESYTVNGNKRELTIKFNKEDQTFPLNGGVGAIPFRPELLDNPEYREIIHCMFKKFLIND